LSMNRDDPGSHEVCKVFALDPLTAYISRHAAGIFPNFGTYPGEQSRWVDICGAGKIAALTTNKSDLHQCMASSRVQAGCRRRAGCQKAQGSKRSPAMSDIKGRSQFTESVCARIKGYPEVILVVCRAVDVRRAYRKLASRFKEGPLRNGNC
jgi:hypothetical protein